MTACVGPTLRHTVTPHNNFHLLLWQIKLDKPIISYISIHFYQFLQKVYFPTQFTCLVTSYSSCNIPQSPEGPLLGLDIQYMYANQLGQVKSILPYCFHKWPPTIKSPLSWPKTARGQTEAEMERVSE